MTQSLQPHITASRSFWVGVVVFVLTIIGMVALVMGIQSAMENRSVLPISSVRVVGERHHLNDADIQAVLNTGGGLDSLVMQDVIDVQQRVSTLPWVDTVAVRKSFPDSLSLYVVEQKPAALWNDDALLNERAEVFVVPNRGEAGDLIQASGPEGSSKKVLEHLKRFTQLLSYHGMQLADIALTARHAWLIQLDSGVELRLGREDGLNRINRFIQLFESLTDTERALIAYVDLRYDTGAAVGWKPEADQAEAGKKDK